MSERSSVLFHFTLRRLSVSLQFLFLFQFCLSSSLCVSQSSLQRVPSVALASCVLLLQTLLPSIVTQQRLLPSSPSGRIRVCRSSPLLCAGDLRSVPSWHSGFLLASCAASASTFPGIAPSALFQPSVSGSRPPSGASYWPLPVLLTPVPGLSPVCHHAHHALTGGVRPSLSLTAPAFACRFPWLSYPYPTWGELCSWRRGRGDDCTPPCSCPWLGPVIGRKRYFHGRKRHP